MAGPVTIQEFERLVDDARREGGRRHSGEHRAASPGTRGPEPTLTLGNYGLTDVDPAVRQRRGMAVPASMALHAAAMAAIVIVPLLLADVLPEPGGDIRAFFVEPIAAPPPVKPVRVGGDVREPRKVLNVAPVYPLLATKAHVEGIVIIEATIDPRGRVVNATVLKSVPVLDEAALEAVRQWVYMPTLLNGIPTPIIMTVTVRFRLKATS